MIKQLELLKEPKVRKKVKAEVARMMIAYLVGKGGWHKGKEIMQAYGWHDSRPCRLGCEGAHGRIIFSQDGYKMTRLATLDEIDMCGATILSQIEALQEKYRLLMIRRHKQDVTS